VLAAIKPGEEQRLRAVLRTIGDDIRGRRLPEAGRSHIDFSRSRSIHFARFAIFDDPDRGPDRTRLLYSANYDGDLDSHLAELIAITSDMAAIWGSCEGYTGPADFARFITTHAHQPDAFYIAFRDGSVERIQQSIAVRRNLQPLLDLAAAGPLMTILPALSPDEPSWVRATRRAFTTAGREISDAIARSLRAIPLVGDVFRAIARCGIRNVFAGAQRITASLDRYRVLRLLNRITRNHVAAPRSPYSSVGLDACSRPVALVPGDELPVGPANDILPTFREDVVTQNQLTLVTVIKPGQLNRVRGVMAAIDSYSKRLSPPGSLIGISTIHFVKWLVVDGGRRLMLVSDYDGSWESYIDEFAEMILSGLDAIWETSYGYPLDGARDLPAFKRFLRSHQVPSEVFFSAYPGDTVLNILNDRAFTHACFDAAADPAGLLQQL
jgi:hypothetical protein